MFVIVGIECASIKGVRNVLRGRPVFALLMAVVVAALFPAVTRVPVINSFVQPTVVARGANTKVAISQQWEVPVFALLMVAVAGVRWKVVTSLPNHQQNSVLSMEVARNAVLRGATKFHVDVLNSVLQ